jgi:hypothetical protein
MILSPLPTNDDIDKMRKNLNDHLIELFDCAITQKSF